jgi:DNA-binding beta-propeller fold protein YncE
MVLTPDEELLIGAAGPRVVFIDVRRLVSGQGDPVLGYWTDGNAQAGRFYINVTSDGQYLFVSNEGARSISVLDLTKARASAFGAAALIGTIPVGNAPIALTFSPDGRYLFSTSQSMPESAGWAVECKPERDQQLPPNHTRGAIFVIDVRQAVSNPASAVVGTVQAGCNPVRLALSPKGDVAYVSARGDHRVLVFDAQKLVSDPMRALLGSVPVGTAPVGILTIDSGRRVIVTSSNRFAGSPSDKQPLYVVDSSRVHLGADAVLGVVQAGAFPRELRTSADGRTLFVTNFNSQTLQVIDVTRLPVEPTPRAVGEK